MTIYAPALECSNKDSDTTDRSYNKLESSKYFFQIKTLHISMGIVLTTRVSPCRIQIDYICIKDNPNCYQLKIIRPNVLKIRS